MSYVYRGQAQPHGEDEDVIEHHIEQAAAQGGHHGKGRVAVVADEGREDVVAHEEGCEQQEDAGVVQAQRHNVRIAAHELQERARGKRAYGNMRSFLFFYFRIGRNEATRNFPCALWKDVFRI